MHDEEEETNTTTDQMRSTAAVEEMRSENTTPPRWTKNMPSPNPAGRPKNPANAAEVRELAREKSGAMLEFLSRTALNPKVAITARVQCATEVLNRAWGRPQQSVDLNHGVQSDLAALLDEIDGRHRLRTITATPINDTKLIEIEGVVERDDNENN